MNAYAIPKDFDQQIEKFVRYIMIGGKLNTARKIMRDCFASLKEKGYSDPKESFQRALTTVMPSVEVKPKRFGGSVYQIPVQVSEKRQFFLAARWIIAGSRAKKGMSMHEKLAQEINDILNETGYAFKKKEEVFKMAQANRAFAHLGKF